MECCIRGTNSLFSRPSWRAQLAGSKDGKVVAIGATDGTVQIWSAATAKNEEVPVDSLAGIVKSRWFSPDQESVAVIKPDGEVSLRGWTSLRLKGTPNRFRPPLGFSSDGTLLLSINWPTNTDAN